VGGDEELPAAMSTPEIKRLSGIALKEKVSDMVQFTGRKCRHELKYFYGAADLFITTPWYEPFGITPLEAMACGTPVIGANVGGIKYSVADGVTGILVPPNDPDVLANTIDRCIEDPSMRRSMSKRAVDWVNQFFTWGSVATSLKRLYKIVSRSQVVSAGKHEFAA